MSCLLKIKEIFSSLTLSEQKIAEYVLANKDEVISCSAQKLSIKIGTSPATLVRFAKSLGYQGLPELKIDLAKDSLDDNLDLTRDLRPGESIKNLSQKIFNHRISNLDKLMKLINYDCIEQASFLLKNAATIYFVGVGASGLVCRDLYHKFSRIGKRVVYDSDFHIALSIINNISESDVMLAISYSGSTMEVNLALEVAKERGAKVIAITQMGKNALNKLSDVTCHVPSCEKYLRVGAIESRDASLYIADLLYLSVAMTDFENTNSKLKQSRELVNRI